MGCDFWIDTEEDAPSVVTRMTGIQPSWATTKGEIFRTIPNEIMPSREIPGKFFKQNLWKLSGTTYFEKDDHLIPFKSIDMLEMIEKQKSSFQKIFRNYKYKCLLHFCYTNRHKLQFRIPPELWKRIAPYGLLSTSTCTYSVKARKITLTESRPEPKWAVRSISRPERMTRVSLPR